jgi:MFS superfamily sulfate permease-like transporter
VRFRARGLFLNGVAILIAVSQLKPHVSPGAGLFGNGIGEPGRLVAMLALAGFMLGFPALARRAPAWLPLAKVPPVLAAFAGGIAGYYLLNWSLPVVDLGPTIGAVQVGFSSPLFALNDSRFWDGIRHSGWQIVSTSLVLAIVATLDTLLALRSAQECG